MAGNREKKRIVTEGVNRLLNTPGWNPWEFAASNRAAGSVESEAESAVREAVTSNIIDESSDCPQCALERQKSGDETALCPEHMKKAMGL